MNVSEVLLLLHWLCFEFFIYVVVAAVNSRAVSNSLGMKCTSEPNSKSTY